MKTLKPCRLTLTLVATLLAVVPVHANITVLNTNDSGSGSLRDAVVNAPVGAVISFAPALSGRIILLTSGQIELSNNVTIDASALTNGIQINGNNSTRIFEVTNSTVTLNGLTITNGNDDNDSTYGGGGVLNLGTLTLSNCTFSGNHATNSFGGAIEQEGVLMAYGCTFSSNFVSGGSCTGGAIDDFSSTQGAAQVMVANSTFFGNLANSDIPGDGLGGAISISGISGAPTPAVAAVNCTFYGNQAADGGGIYNSGTLNLTNSIVSGDTADTSNNIDGFYSDVNNLVDVADLNLSPLGNYGGPTQTILPLPGSPPIDAGDDSVTSFLTTDQRGYPRRSGTHVDIGAVEVLENAPASFCTIRMANGQAQIQFTNFPNFAFTVFASTNVALPTNTWSNLGPALEIPAGSGQYQFIDVQATNFPKRFYRVRSD